MPIVVAEPGDALCRVAARESRSGGRGLARACRCASTGKMRAACACLQRSRSETGARLLATTEPLHHVAERNALLDVLTCIREKTTLDSRRARCWPQMPSAI